MIKMEIETCNAAFAATYFTEFERILDWLTEQSRRGNFIHLDGPQSHTIRDVNGNYVGYIQFTPDEE
jgi:hypothetical protein